MSKASRRRQSPVPIAFTETTAEAEAARHPLGSELPLDPREPLLVWIAGDAPVLVRQDHRMMEPGEGLRLRRAIAPDLVSPEVLRPAPLGRAGRGDRGSGRGGGAAREEGEKAADVMRETIQPARPDAFEFVTRLSKRPAFLLEIQQALY